MIGVEPHIYVAAFRKRLVLLPDVDVEVRGERRRMALPGQQDVVVLLQRIHVSP